MPSAQNQAVEQHAHDQQTPPLWTVSLIFTNADGQLPVITNDAKRRLLEELAGRMPILGFGEDNVAITFDVHASDHRIAAAVASASCDDAFLAAGLPAVQVAQCQTVRSDRLAALTARTPDLVGVSEIAELLGFSKQRAWQCSKTAQFPAIACHPKAGPLWRRSDIERFGQNRRRG